MTPKKKLRVVAYVRISKRNGRDGDRYIAPEVQREDIERYVAGHGHELVDVIVEEDQSGGTLDRPGLQRALSALEAGEADALAVAYLSRLSRRVLDGLNVVQRLAEARRHVLIADLDIDTSTATGKAILSVLLAFAELELDQRRASWAQAQMKALARKVYPGSTSTAYRRDEDGRMVPDPVVAPIIAGLYEKRAAGMSWAKLARGLDKDFPRDDGQPWRPATVRSMLMTPVNVGRLERTVSGERVVVNDAHEPIVSRALWEEVVNGSGAARGPKQRALPAMLAGLVRCGSCGRAMTRGNGAVKRNARGERVTYDSYLCSQRCPQQARVSVRAADAFVLGHVLEHLAASEAAGASRGTRGDIHTAEHELEAAEAELDAYLSAISAADVGAAAFARGARERRERVDAARQSLANAGARARVAGPSHDDLVARLPDMDDGERNAILRTLIDHVVVKKSGRAVGRASDAHERISVVMCGDDGAEDALGVGDHVGRERAAAA